MFPATVEIFLEVASKSCQEKNEVRTLFLEPRSAPRAPSGRSRWPLPPVPPGGGLIGANPVVRGSEKLGQPSRGFRLSPVGFCETEVEDLDRAFLGELQVRRFEIAMDDALLVRGLEAFGDLLGDGDGFAGGDRTALQALGEVFAFYQLQREREDAVRLLEPVDRGDVGMIQRGEELRFAPEPRDALGILRERRGQDLDWQRRG